LITSVTTAAQKAHFPVVE